MKKYSLMWLVVLAGIWASCSDNNEEQRTPTPSITLEGESTQLLFGTSGGSLSVSFEASVGWTADVDQSWCRVSPASGQAGHVSVMVTADENDTYDERNAKLTLAAGGVSKTLVIVQKQKDALTVTSNRVDVDSDGGEIAVEIKANVTFEYEVEEAASEWIVPIETKALTTTNLRFSVAANENAEKREGRIVVRSGEMEETVTVYQGGYTPTLVLSQNEYTVSSAGEEIVIELNTNLDYEMILPEEADWISEPPTRALSTYTHRIQVAPNDTYDLREAEIHFINREAEIDETVHIVQVQNDAIVVARSSYEVVAEGERLDFTVQSNVEFSVLLSEEWIEQVPVTRALEEVPLSFTVEANPDREPREATITLKADNVEHMITALQAGHQETNCVSIVYSGEQFTVPLITGEYFMNAYIWWGDGSEREAYREGAVHAYDGAGPHTVVIESAGAEEIALSDLVGVSEIDLSEF